LVGVFLFLLGVAVGVAATFSYLSGLGGRGGFKEAGRRGGGDAASLPSDEAASRDAGALPGRDGRGASPAKRDHRGGQVGQALPADRALAAGQGSSGRAGVAAAGQAGAARAAGPAAAGARRSGSDAVGTGAGGPPRVALVIDDLGRSLEELESLYRLGVPITYAVLPFEVQTPEVAAALRRRHEEILCHLPMEPKSGGNPGPGALRAGMSPEELRQSTLAAIAAVPGAIGVNNHMGSALSADAGSMATILGVLAAHGLYFLDSRTSSQSVGFRLATALGVPAAERQVFLDDDLRAQAVATEFQRLLEVARTRGAAIAIGHPHPATLATLAAEVPRAQALGYRFVAVSALLDRPAAVPPGSF
jgi:polysaccharide deacetylase 2 family uncharacterized protein YibQ